MYARVADGGFVIIDDWGIAEARRAVVGFFEAHGATPPTLTCAAPDDCTTAFWRKGAADALAAPDRALYDAFCASRSHRSGQSIRINVGSANTELAVTATRRRGGEMELTVDGQTVDGFARAQPLEGFARALCAEQAPELLLKYDMTEDDLISDCAAAVEARARAHFDSPLAEAVAIDAWF